MNTTNKNLKSDFSWKTLWFETSITGKKETKKGANLNNPVVEPRTGIIAKINTTEMKTSLLYSCLWIVEIELNIKIEQTIAEYNKDMFTL